MHEHPNQHHLTPQPPIIGQIAAAAAPALQEFSLDEKNQEFLDSCVQAASCAVDEARAELTAALTGPDHGWADLAARAYKQAALLHTEARQQRYELRVAAVGTPEWSAAERGRWEMRQDLLAALQDAEQREMLAGSAQDILAELDSMDLRDAFLPPPALTLSEESTMRGDLR